MVDLMKENKSLRRQLEETQNYAEDIFTKLENTNRKLETLENTIDKIPIIEWERYCNA